MEHIDRRLEIRFALDVGANSMEYFQSESSVSAGGLSTSLNGARDVATVAAHFGPHLVSTLKQLGRRDVPAWRWVSVRMGRGGLEPPTSALSRRERRSAEFAIAYKVTLPKACWRLPESHEIV